MGPKGEWHPWGPEEIYTVTVRRDPITGVVVREEWEKDGKSHCDHGPAVIFRDRVTGVVVREKWRRNNKPHREDGPSCILRKPDGRVYLTQWWKDGVKIVPPKRPRSARQTACSP